MHLLRNSLDHGIEPPQEREEKGKNRTATLLLNAFQSGNNIYVEIKDDGRGLNRKAIAEKAVALGLVEATETMSDEEVYNLIFHPGFSTAREVTDVSGRGVGMNVVRKMVQEFKGSIHICMDGHPPKQYTPPAISVLTSNDRLWDEDGLLASLRHRL